MDTKDDNSAPRKPIFWRDQVANRQAELGLKPDPVPARVTTITPPGTPRATAMIRDALHPQNVAADRAEAFPFARQISGPRYASDGSGRQQGGVAPSQPARTTPAAASSTRVPTAAAAAIPAAAAPAAPRPAAPLPRPGASAPSGTPGVQFNTGAATDAKLPTQPSIGYFIGSDGKRRDITANQANALAAKVQTVPEAAAAAGAAGAPLGTTLRGVGTPGFAPQTAALQRPNAVALGQQAIATQRQEGAAQHRAALAPLADIGGTVPVSELLRRKQHAENSYFNKGSPSGRARAAGAYDALLGAYIGAGAMQQQQVGNTAAGAASQEAGLGAAEVEGAENRGAALRDSMLRAQLQREQLDAAAPVLTLEGGTTARIGRDGVVRPLVGMDGQPVRGQQNAAQLDPTEVFKAAVAQRGEITNNPLLDPEARATALAEFDASPLGQSIAAALPSSRQSAGASQIPPEAIAILRQNPGKAAEFESTFNLPAGAAAQYLGN